VGRIVALAALVLAVGAAAVQDPSVQTRTFTGTGSLGIDSPIEIYLIGGTYHHRLVGSTDCHTNAGLYPAREPDGVLLADVIRTDLSVGRPEADPARSLIISRPGWANLQVGTGRDCEWTYSIRGAFLAEGDEPATESDRDFSWLLLAGTAIVASLAVLALRRRSPTSPAKKESPIRVIDPGDE